MMEEKNEFDDIILDKGNKNEKIKKILLRTIILVILFLVVLIVMRLINNDNTKENSIVPTEPIVNENNETNNGFENMPIIESNIKEDEFEALKKQIQEDNNESIVDVNESLALPESNNTQIIPVAPQTQEPQIQEKPKPSVETSKKETPKAPKKEVKTEVKKQQSTNDLFKNISTVSSELPAGTYIQIFSVSNPDSKSKELALIKKNGYEYKFYKTNVKGKEITKVLVGPFSKDTINKEMSKIRANINKDAFVFSVK
ncbi:SPOR domain-containing protein [Campylobacter jejuni]|nr:SPOR domain-containing protein [Campylobacter sp. US33a]MCW1360762.1 SPOR domain-containing protein [Campylobacter jejuni]TEY00548.1 SPOR domain-containing protein [Campylobacter sp. US33a]